MVRIKISNSDDIHTSPRSSLERMVHEFISGHELDDSVSADFVKELKNVDDKDEVKALRGIYEELLSAYSARSKLREGKLNAIHYHTHAVRMIECYEVLQGVRPGGYAR